MMEIKVRITIITLLIFYLTGCSFNPFVRRHHETGSPAGVLLGAAAGAGSVGLLGGPKPLIIMAGLGGGAIGYYVTTLRFAAGGIIQHGGEVYQIGEYVNIYIPTDNFFEENTANLLPQARPVLESVTNVLKRYPTHHVLISGNTSGFASSQWERHLSEERAKQVAFYLWRLGIPGYPTPGRHRQQLAYVGYGDYFPIATHQATLHEDIRMNSRIQIASYPIDLR